MKDLYGNVFDLINEVIKNDGKITKKVFNIMPLDIRETVEHILKFKNIKLKVV